MKIKNAKLVKAIGIGAAIGGAILSVVASWASDRQMEATIDEKVTSKINSLLAPTHEFAEATKEIVD